MAVSLIANPHAGGGRARHIALESARRLNDLGVQTQVALPSTLLEMLAAIDKACLARPDVVIACGGDGTVHQVLQSAVKHDIAIAVIPAGTGNDIARSLGISVKRPEGWVTHLAELINDARVDRVDLARISHDDRQVWSLGVVSAGFDSAVNERADRISRLQGTPRYVAALLAELGSFRLHDYEVVIDGMRISGKALLIAVGNGESYGGGMKICPTADMTDGLLDVTWIDSAPRRTVLRVFPRIFSGRHVEHRLVRTFRAREIVINAIGPIVYADGERVGRLPVKIEIVPRALGILRP